VIGPVGVVLVFKGSGFYSTDNRSTSGLSTPKSNDSSSEKSESKSKTEDAKSESKSGEKKRVRTTN
jgi:hypothetical protein